MGLRRTFTTGVLVVMMDVSASMVVDKRRGVGILGPTDGSEERGVHEETQYSTDRQVHGQRAWKQSSQCTITAVEGEGTGPLFE